MAEERPIRVMIVDDHEMLRMGLRLFLKGFDDLELVGEAESGIQAVSLCAQVRPDVILMDMVMPDLDGADTTHLILREHPGVKIIILTSFRDREQVAKAIKAGAVGYLFKNASASELATAIRDARAGKSVLAPEAIEVLLEAARHKDDHVDYGLTPREKEVLDLLVEGMSNAQIAHRLTVSLATAKFHVSCILVKLGVSSRTEAVSVALHHGLAS